MIESIEGTPVVAEETVSELLERDAEGSSLFEHLFEIYKEEYPELLQSLRDARAAGDSEACYEAIHQMKGSAAAMGATRVFALAKKAIELCRSKEILTRDDVGGILEGEMERYCEEMKKRRA